MTGSDRQIYMLRSILKFGCSVTERYWDLRKNISTRYPRYIIGRRIFFIYKYLVNVLVTIKILLHSQWQPEVTDDNFISPVHSTNDISIISEQETEGLNQRNYFKHVLSCLSLTKQCVFYSLCLFLFHFFKLIFVIDQLLAFRVSVYTDCIIGLLLWKIKQTIVLSKLVCTRDIKEYLTADNDIIYLAEMNGSTTAKLNVSTWSCTH